MRANYRSTIAVAASVAAFLLVPAPGSSSAFAEDTEETEQKDAAPALPPLTEFNDRDLTISIKLPQEWKAKKGSPELPTLASFVWPSKDGGGNRATLDVLLQRGYAQPELARQFNHKQIGEVVDGSLRRGKGFSQACVISSRSPQAIFDRFVAKDGFVYHVRFVCHKSNREANEALVAAVMDTFEVRKPYTVPDMPKEWRRSRHKPFTVWCDDDDKGTPGRVMGPVLGVRSVMAKALKGDPVDPLAPAVRIYRNAASYEKDCTAATGQMQTNAAFDSNNRALLVELMQEGNQGFEWSIQQMAAAQYIQQYFGGGTPLWIRRGLMIYGAVAVAESGGKPDKAPKARMKKVKGVVITAKRRLDQFFDLESRDVKDDQKSFDELWAWHWYFRHAKGGKKYRKTYTKCLEVLRSTGDIEAAHAVWDGTDFKKLQNDWKDWARKLK